MKTLNIYLIIYKDRVMYVGCTNNLNHRISQHFNTRNTIPKWVNRDDVKFEVVASFESMDEALKFENKLITDYDTIRNGWNKYRSGLVWRENKGNYKKQYRSEHRKELIDYDKNYHLTHPRKKSLA